METTRHNYNRKSGLGSVFKFMHKERNTNNGQNTYIDINNTTSIPTDEDIIDILNYEESISDGTSIPLVDEFSEVEDTKEEDKNENPISSDNVYVCNNDQTNKVEEIVIGPGRRHDHKYHVETEEDSKSKSTVPIKKAERIKFKMNSKGCFINGMPFDPQNLPPGVIVNVDQKSSSSKKQ